MSRPAIFAGRSPAGNPRVSTKSTDPERGKSGLNDTDRLIQPAAKKETTTRLFENRIANLHVMVSSPNDPFSEEEAATYLKLPEDSVRYFAIRTGELAYCNLGKGRRIYLRKDLDFFLAQRRKPSIHEKRKARSRRKGAET
jgi:Helix-turn-helix domain